MVDALKIVKFEFKNINLVKIQVNIRISVPMSYITFPKEGSNYNNGRLPEGVPEEEIQQWRRSCLRAQLRRPTTLCCGNN